MNESFSNVYDDEHRAKTYADLDFPGTYYLAFRDIPALIERHVSGNRALDFGCGAGRSTRFLRQLGFDVLGVDISEAMIRKAKDRDPQGRYTLLEPDDLTPLGDSTFDLVLCAFTFDNIPGRSRRTELLMKLGARLAPGGRIINLVSSPEIYLNEWLSFSTREFPENSEAKSGDRVRIIMLDVPDRRPVEDVLWTDTDYREAYSGAGLSVIERHCPLGTSEDQFEWVSESTVAPWTIYVLEPVAYSVAITL